MDIGQLDQVDKSSPETFSDSSLSSDSPNTNDKFGEPLVHPRVGKYQVEIPSVLNKSELLHGLFESRNNVGKSNVSSAKEESNVKVDAFCSLAPGESSAPWSDTEADSFLLGMYIFGKNFIQVMKFMESKGIGEILAYYYGRFYGSTGFRKWSECRKMRNKKCVPGHRFFTVYRQHELFACLSPRLSKESKTKFIKVSKAFAEGRAYLEEYVSSVKALVGIHAIVEAVGIGKGKDDLTALVLDGTRKNHPFTHRPEIPSGKAFSSLTFAEIVKFLTGDFRLSKARSNDLFWEAVWPRLLARGWHSEQHRGDNYAGLKNCLVFLMPGIKKFSRRKLSKGDHYFDSVSDLLEKVCSEPQLLELEADKTTSSSKVDNGWVVDMKSDDVLDLSDPERHRYLKPHVSSKILKLSNFTVVDTSLANKENPSKIRELRSLPLSAKRCSSFKRTNKLKIKATSSHSKGFTSADGSSERMPGSQDLVPLQKPGVDNLPEDHRSRTIKLKFSRRNKPHLAGCTSGEVAKRRRIATCAETEVTWVLEVPATITYDDETENKSKDVAASKPMIATNAVLSGATQFENAEVISTRTSAGDTSDDKTLLHKSLTDFCCFISRGKENVAQEPYVMDLNLPQVEPESDGKVKREGGEDCVFRQPESKKPEHFDAKDHLPSCATLETTNKGGGALDQQQPRRKSTRNRPLTTKALEALEIGFLSAVRQSRKRPPSTLKEQKSKCLGKLRKKSCMFSSAEDFEARGEAY